MGRSPRRAVAIVLLGLAVLPRAAPSARRSGRPVAVRGESMPAPPPPAPPPPRPRRRCPSPPGWPSIPFFDCTERRAGPAAGGARPSGRCRWTAVRSPCPPTPTSPARAGSRSACSASGSPEHPADLPPLLVLGDTAGEAVRAGRRAAGRAGPPGLLERYRLIGSGPPRRPGRTAGLRPGRRPGRRSWTGISVAPARRSWPRLLEDARGVVQECNISLDGGLASYRTPPPPPTSSRCGSRLGVDRLSAIGVGDGAAALAGWARTAPGGGRPAGARRAAAPHPGRARAQRVPGGAAEAAFEAFAVSCTGPAGVPARAPTRGPR